MAGSLPQLSPSYPLTIRRRGCLWRARPALGSRFRRSWGGARRSISSAVEKLRRRPGREGGLARSSLLVDDSDNRHDRIPQHISVHPATCIEAYLYITPDVHLASEVGTAIRPKTPRSPCSGRSRSCRRDSRAARSPDTPSEAAPRPDRSPLAVSPGSRPVPR